MKLPGVVVVLIGVIAARQGAAQERIDTLMLSALQETAVKTDPRAKQIELLALQSSLRKKTLSAEFRPSVSADGFAQYQSDVAKIPITLPGGVEPPSPPRQTFDSRLSVQQRLYDPSIRPRRAVEDARVAQSQARVRTALFTLRQSVNDAFFVALTSQIRIGEIEASITDLEAQRRVAAARVAEGTALQSEETALRAELLRRRQQQSEARATRSASLEVLSDLTGRSIDTTVVLGEPRLASAVAATRGQDRVFARPELQQFERTRDLLQQERRARAAQDLPRLAAFARTGYGRPGLNALSDRFDAYWLGGLMLQWTPWNWGSTARDQQVLDIERAIVSTEEAAFIAGLRRSVVHDLAAIDRLQAAVADDDEIVSLREAIAAEARLRYSEGVLTSAEYVDRQTDVLTARIARATHRVELAQAQARYLTTLGLEVR